MRITCPSCEAAYDVPESVIAARRMLRCAKCASNFVPQVAGQSVDSPAGQTAPEPQAPQPPTAQPAAPHAAVQQPAAPMAAPPMAAPPVAAPPVAAPPSPEPIAPARVVLPPLSVEPAQRPRAPEPAPVPAPLEASPASAAVLAEPPPRPASAVRAPEGAQTRHQDRPAENLFFPREPDIELDLQEPPRRTPTAVVATLWVLSLAILGGLGWGFVAYRQPIIQAWPPSARLYAALGLNT